MVFEARLRIRHRGCFTERLHGAAHGAQLASDRDSEVVVLHAPNPGTLDAVVAHVAEARGRSPVIASRSAQSVVLRLSSPSHPIGAEIAAAGCTVVWPALFANGEEAYTVLAASRERLDALLVRLATKGAVTLERVAEIAPGSMGPLSVPVADITTALTERQLLVLQKAIAEGYYDSPRRTSTEALAATFGVTRSTLEEHLRKAERRVLEGFAGVLLAQPVLARAAARRPGRPARATPAR